MHIFKSRNPIWLILDIIITIWMWRAGVLVAAIAFTYDSILQFIYTFFPDMVDAWEKKKTYKAVYVILLTAGIFFLIRHLIDENIL